MARYYFHLNECSDEIKDEEGLELPDLRDVRSEALRSARCIMADEISQGRLCLGCHIRVSDAFGTTLMEVAFRQAVVVNGL